MNEIEYEYYSTYSGDSIGCIYNVSDANAIELDENRDIRAIYKVTKDGPLILDSIDGITSGEVWKPLDLPLPLNSHLLERDEVMSVYTEYETIEPAPYELITLNSRFEPNVDEAGELSKFYQRIASSRDTYSPDKDRLTKCLCRMLNIVYASIPYIEYEEISVIYQRVCSCQATPQWAVIEMNKIIDKFLEAHKL